MQILHFGFWTGKVVVAAWASDRGFDACDGVLGKFEIFDFVLPDSDYLPAHISQVLIIGSVAIHVPLEFCCPVFVVAGWHRSVFGATVPEASIDEDSNFLRWEYHIDFDTTLFEFDVAIFSEA